MLAEPPLIVGVSRSDDNISVHLNRYRVVNHDQLLTSTDINLAVTIRENREFYREWRMTPEGPMVHLENVLITISTDFEWPWKYYLRNLSGKQKGFNVGEWEGGLQDFIDLRDHYDPGSPELDRRNNTEAHGTADYMAKFYVDRNVRLYVYGLVWRPGVDDIFFYDRTYDVEVKPVV
jgi:hypothetical protein